MMKSRQTAILLFGALALAQLTACGNEANTGTKETQAKGQENALATEAVTEAQGEPDDLPETDLNGYNFRMLAFTDDNIEAVYSAEQTGNIVADAVYSKIRTVEERFNCKITMTDSAAGGASSETADEASAMKKPILAGEDIYDIAMGHDITIANMTLEGVFWNLYDVPYLNFSKPWWPEYTVESLSLGKQMYMFSNFISHYSMGDTRVMYFNKDLLRNLDLESPYELVYDHKWTLDKMAELVKEGYADLNGDGISDENDQYGIVNPNYYYAVLEPFGLEPYVDDGNGNLTYQFDVAKNQEIVEKLYNLLFTGAGYIAMKEDVWRNMFSSGQALFTYDSLRSAVKNYSASEITYGILPMPLLNESQKEYFAGCTDRPVVVPLTAEPHLEQTGLIIEAMSAEGYRQVFPAYFEVALKTRYADQTDDAKMIDIIMNNVILSFTYMYGNYASPYNKMLETLFNPKNPKTDVASYAAKIEKTQNKRVEDIMKAYENLR